jgi:tRNA 5-methylaminomethyl-2-thiouridine biosynthesis bifunctional protein
MSAPSSPILPAQLAFDSDGTPYSASFGDVYHSSDGGLEQARHVFLGGNGLPLGWRGHDSFVIVETGFGLGLNFLATWDAWRADAQRPERLHFVSVEQHLFRADDLAQLHRRWPELATPSAQLRRHWPPLVPGFHRLHFERGALTLTLLFGDAAILLPQLAAAADAFYLDGFAPDRNPQMWSPIIFGELARLAKPNATLATWTVAGSVRQGLMDAGFIVAKRQGYGRKRQMLCGALPASQTCRTYQPHAVPNERHAVVIGAGLAGSHAAERLAARGWQVEVLERAAAPAQGASGNLSGVLRPLPSVDDNRLARLTRACFLYAMRHLAALADFGQPVRWQPCGVLHLARDDEHAEKQRRAIEALRLPPEFVRVVTRAQAADLANWPVGSGGWWFPGGGWINPPSLCAANLAAHGHRVHTRYGVEVGALRHDDQGWTVLDTTGAALARAPLVILANGAQAREIEQARHLPLRVARGQVSHLPAALTAPLDIVVTGTGYVTPAIDGTLCAGATFLADDTALDLRTADHRENLARLEFMLPGFAKQIDPASLGGRVGLRPISRDRLPLAGELPRAADTCILRPAHARDVARWTGLYGLLGFGARGLVWAALAAELLACEISGEPLPLPRDLVAALDPARFLVKSARRAASAKA